MAAKASMREVCLKKQVPRGGLRNSAQSDNYQHWESVFRMMTLTYYNIAEYGIITYINIFNRSISDSEGLLIVFLITATSSNLAFTGNGQKEFIFLSSWMNLCDKEEIIHGYFFLQKLKTG